MPQLLVVTCVRLGQRFRNAEVEHLDVAGGPDEQVARLEVGVHEPVVGLAFDRGGEAVRLVEELADADRVSRRDLRIGSGPALIEIRERATLDQLHRDEQVSVAVVAEVVDRRHHAVRLLEALLEHRAVTLGGDPLARVSRVGEQHELQRHPGVVAQPARPPDGAEAALIEGLLAFGRVSTHLPRHRSVSALQRAGDGSAVTMTLSRRICCRSAADDPRRRRPAPYPTKTLCRREACAAAPTVIGGGGRRAPERTKMLLAAESWAPSPSDERGCRRP